MSKTIKCTVLVLVLLATISNGTMAQVTIGSGEKPADGALLDLKENDNIASNSNKGLALPRVDLTSQTNLFPMFKDDGTGGYIGFTKTDEDVKHSGLVVYNLTNNLLFCPGMYTWDGETWNRLEGLCIATPVMTPSTGQFCNLTATPIAVTNLGEYSSAVDFSWTITSSPSTATYIVSGANNEICNISSPSTTTVTVTVKADDNGVVSETTSTIGIQGTPKVLSTPNINICGSGSVALTAIVGDADKIKWYDASIGGNMLAEVEANDSFNIASVTSTTTYYAEPYNSIVGCVPTSRAAVVVTVNPLPTIISTTPNNRCGTGEVVLKASVADGNEVRWYDAPVDGTLLNTIPSNANFTTPSISATTTYYAEAYNSTTTCVSASRTPVVAMVANPPVITSSFPVGSTIVLGDNIDANVVVTGGTAPITYQWYKDGLEIAGATSAVYSKISTQTDVGTYTCMVTSSGGICSELKSVGKIEQILDITQVPDARIQNGTFFGKITFDVAQGNNNTNGCGYLSSRQSRKADFTQNATNTQTYTFTPATTVSNVRFMHLNSAGVSVVKSIAADADYSGTIAAGTPLTATVKYENLNTAASGKNHTNPIKADIYVVFRHGVNFYKFTINPLIADCHGCGAFIGLNKWEYFMCHNLGADQTLDPFAPRKEIYGNYYQWGYKTHVATPDTPRDTTPAGWDAVGKPNDSWLENEKTANDPCPTGYRMMKGYVAGIFEEGKVNDQTKVGDNWTIDNFTNFDNMSLIGQHLPMPTTGFRVPLGINGSTVDGNLYARPRYGMYWTTYSVIGLRAMRAFATWPMYVSNSDSYLPTFAFAIRCMRE